MSADNGIYIAEFSDGFRVAHAQAIENVDYFPEGSKDRKKELKRYFRESKLYNSEEAALEKAQELAKEILEDDFCPVLEYGICFIGKYENF